MVYIFTDDRSHIQLIKESAEISRVGEPTVRHLLSVGHSNNSKQ